MVLLTDDDKILIKFLYNDIIRVTCFGLYDYTIFGVDLKLNGCVYVCHEEVMVKAKQTVCNNNNNNNNNGNTLP